MTKRELQKDNEALRQTLEEIYDTIGEALGIDADTEDNENGDDEGDSDVDEKE